MTRYRRSTLVPLGLVLFVLIFAALACTLSGGGSKKKGTQPTVVATVTPPLTKTPIPTFTPFPSLTPIQYFPPLPTATRIVLAPTIAYPTWTPVQATPYPYDVRISYPVSGSQIAGYITIVGSASHPRFLQYALEWGPDPNPSNLWYPLMPPRNQPVINGGLASWDTRTVQDGFYQIRLHVWLNDGTETYGIVTGLHISNNIPTVVPTLTATPRPNRPPTINPISGQQLSAGQTLTIDVTASDPDGDSVNLFVASSNTAIANAQVTTQTQISVTGVTAGTATITVTANDNRGGLANTAFLVTVQGPNRAPVLSAIPNQTLDVGQNLDVTVSASDPDGDPLTMSAESDNPGIVSVATPAAGTVRLTGVAEGTANVTVTISDGKGGVIRTTFQAAVGRPNVPPTVQMIAPQTMTAGQTLNVPYTASDPDGDPLTASASSDTPGVVTASIPAAGTIQLAAVGAGTATVTLSVTDSINSPTIATFPVTVVTGNSAPAVSPIPPQTMSVGQTLDVPYAASDLDGDPLTASATSDNQGVVAASINAPGSITLYAASAGTATVTLSVNDSHNPPVNVLFTVSVATVNQPPAISSIPPQTLGVGQALDVPYAASDPDGDPLAASASSDNQGVVVANVNAPGSVSLNAVGAGTATVTLSVSDGVNPPVTMPFGVTVVTANQPPAINSIPPQTMSVGQTLDVPYVASDPDGDPLTASAISDNQGVVVPSINAPGSITLNAVGAGTATVTLSVSDGINPPVTMPFGVTVAAVNQPPAIETIFPQTLTAGQALDVPYAAVDPDGDPLTASAVSDNQGVVVPSINAPGSITLSAVGPGTATVTLSVSDGVNPPVTMPFSVTVLPVNSNPVIQQAGDQAVNVGASLSVPIVASDPDGDQIALSAVSNNPAVATAVANGPAEVVIGGVTPGTATVTVDADDGRGGTATISFQVTVVGVNNPPVIEPIPDQSLAMGEQISIQVNVSDPDGDQVTLSAISQDGGVVAAQAVDTTITLQAVGAGVASVQVTADDARGGVTTASFNVSVSSPQPTFNLMDYPVVPQIPQSMATSLNQLYQSGVTNFGNRAGAFSKIGDDAMASSNFMVPFAAAGQYDLGNFGSLQATIDFFGGTPVRSDTSINSFNATSIAAGGGYGIDSLSGPAPAGPPCDAVGGGTLLSCELQLTKPSIAVISFSAANVTYMPPEQFRGELQSLVADMLSNYGVIPVLATIPAGNGYSTEQLAEYNRAIVEVASQSGITGVPLWNLWRAMQERGIGDPNSVAPQGPANFTDAALSYGYNIRNLTALQVLEAVRQAAGIG
jgi:uncharacterized protein YjdB